VIMGAVIDAAAGDYRAAQPVLRDQLDRPELVVSLRWLAEGAHTELLVRRGDPEAGPAVDRLWERACADGRVQDRAWACTISAEYVWAFGRQDDLATARNLEVFAEVAERAPGWVLGEFALWLWLDGHLEVMPDGVPEPIRWLGDGHWRRSADWFADRGVPFEQAVALGHGDTDARLEALRIAQRIGAGALAARLRGQLRADGVTGIPRGPRRATWESPLDLTPRQAEVLDLLADGLSNAEIADRLFLSVRTVENHVSAILATLGVENRDAAVAVTTAGGSGRGPEPPIPRAPASQPP
jgi:DNA-binding CsgD family transcriptional regulator